MIAALLAILASMFFGLSVVQNRKGLERSNYLSAILVVTIVGNMVFWVLVLLTVPLEKAIPTGVLLFILAGLFTPGIGRLAYFKGMEKLGASLNASLHAIYPLFSSIIAVLVLSERPTAGIWMGMPCIIAGGILLERSVHNFEGSSVKGARRNLVYPILGALLSAFGVVVKKIGLNVYDEPVMGVSLTYLTTLCAYTLIISMSSDMRRSTSLSKENFRVFGKGAIGMCCGWFCSLYALRYGEVTVVSSLLNTEPLFVLFFTYLFIRKLEKPTLKLVGGTIVVLLGIFCIILF